MRAGRQGPTDLGERQRAAKRPARHGATVTSVATTSESPCVPDVIGQLYGRGSGV